MIHSGFPSPILLFPSNFLRPSSLFCLSWIFPLISIISLFFPPCSTSGSVFGCLCGMPSYHSLPLFPILLSTRHRVCYLLVVPCSSYYLIILFLYQFSPYTVIICSTRSLNFDLSKLCPSTSKNYGNKGKLITLLPLSQ